MFNIPNSILSVIKAGPDDRVVAMKGDTKITVVDLVKEIERQRVLIERMKDHVKKRTFLHNQDCSCILCEWLKDAELSGNSGTLKASDEVNDE